ALRTCSVVQCRVKKTRSPDFRLSISRSSALATRHQPHDTNEHIDYYIITQCTHRICMHARRLPVVPMRKFSSSGGLLLLYATLASHSAATPPAPHATRFSIL